MARIESVDDTEGVYNLLYADGFQGAVSKHGGVRRLNKKEMNKYRVRHTCLALQMCLKYFINTLFRMRSLMTLPLVRSWS